MAQKLRKKSKFDSRITKAKKWFEGKNKSIRPGRTWKNQWMEENRIQKSNWNKLENGNDSINPQWAMCTQCSDYTVDYTVVTTVPSCLDLKLFQIRVS